MGAKDDWEDPVSQIHSPHLHIGAPWDLFRSFKVCSDAKERVVVRRATGSYRT